MGETMQHVFAPLRKLQWQLSLSYIMVVMVAIPALLGVGLALLVILTPPATRLSPAEQLVQGVESQIPPSVMHPGLSTQQFLLQKLQLDTPESQNVIRAAFANDQRLDNLVYTFVDGRTIAAVPV